LLIEKPKGALTTSLSGTVIEQDQVMAVQAGVSGEVFVTANSKRTADPRGLAIYSEAFSGLHKVGFWPTSAEVEPREVEFVEEEMADVSAAPEDKEPTFRYPLHYSGIGKTGSGRGLTRQ
jgi:hypothetical protein